MWALENSCAFLSVYGIFFVILKVTYSSVDPFTLSSGMALCVIFLLCLSKPVQLFCRHTCRKEISMSFPLGFLGFFVYGGFFFHFVLFFHFSTVYAERYKILLI